MTSISRKIESSNPRDHRCYHAAETSEPAGDSETLCPEFRGYFRNMSSPQPGNDGSPERGRVHLAGVDVASLIDGTDRAFAYEERGDCEPSGTPIYNKNNNNNNNNNN